MAGHKLSDVVLCRKISTSTSTISTSTIVRMANVLLKALIATRLKCPAFTSFSESFKFSTLHFAEWFLANWETLLFM